MNTSLKQNSTTVAWEYVIGLEIHAQISSKSKLFSGASTDFGALPNSQVSLIDAAMPGTLPVLNKYCVEQAIKTGLALNTKINKVSIFDRKNYFYADLPSGYQISQFYHPIAEGGWLDIISNSNGQEVIKRVRINRIHLEQDAGKSIHDQLEHYSLIDLNRSGVGLMEIVSEPDLNTAEEVEDYIKKLRSILRYVGSCDGDMEKGSLRCDVNVSVRKPGDPLGTRCEIKNVNSISQAIKAIEYETQRQIEIIESGNVVLQETRLYDAAIGATRAMRSKEDAYDYRYFPDPDLMPLVLQDGYIESLSFTLPELPAQKYQRYLDQYGLPNKMAMRLIADKEVADFFESVLEKMAKISKQTEADSIKTNAYIAANWIINRLFEYLNQNKIEFSQNPLLPEDLAELISLIQHKVISDDVAKTIVLKEMLNSRKKATKIVEEQNLKQIDNHDLLATVVEEILKSNPQKVAEYKEGKTRLIDFFIGQAMKETKGKASPEMISSIVRDRLK